MNDSRNNYYCVKEWVKLLQHSSSLGITNEQIIMFLKSKGILPINTDKEKIS